ncbi:MAG TPA: response regulator [Gemmatimonadaceae bacterium]|nr:response regulator [Gemmatimonadaceae bacterium]
MPVHVLVVEDSALVVGALQLLLESSGYRVSSAGSVGEGVEQARRDPPDLMLLDLTLPDGDGLEVLTRLSADDRPLPVAVAVTGHDAPEVRERCLRAGCRAVLVKPIQALALPGQVRDWVMSNES